MSDEQQQKPKREPLRLWVSVDANGGVMLRGEVSALQQLQGLCDKAIERIEDGDGSISYPLAQGKKVVPLTVVAF